jgi:DNA-binding XRE family transcriptional regulator/predicted RNase H-like HicB family nuclease
MHFPARITHDGRYTVAIFPDCPGCATAAGPGEDILAEAAEALEGWLEVSLEYGEFPARPRRRRRGRFIDVPVPAALAVRIALRWKRQDLGLTQAEFGKRLGITRQAIHLFEAKGANPRLDTLEKIADALGVDLEINFRERKRAS